MPRLYMGTTKTFFDILVYTKRLLQKSLLKTNNFVPLRKEDNFNTNYGNNNIHLQWVKCSGKEFVELHFGKRTFDT